MRERSLLPELMDSPDIDPKLLERFHKDLARIHFFLGTQQTILKFLRKGPQPIRRILDIGCGDGALLAYLRKKTAAEVVGVDLRPVPHHSVPMLAANAITEDLPEADVAVCSLFNHHLSPDDNISLIRNVGRSCRRFLISDLVRHPLPLTLFTVFLCPLVGREAGADGRQSIRRAYTPDEFAKLVRTAIHGTGGTFEMDVSLFRSRQIIDIRF